MTGADPLRAFVAQSLAREVPAEVRALAEELARRFGADGLAILAYGSCLRGVPASQSLIDLYVLTRDLAGASRSVFGRLGCRLAPPNVHYLEHGGVRAKYAVVPLELFARWMEPATANPYFWARFAQPSALLVALTPDAHARVVAAIARALRTAFGNAKGLVAETGDPLLPWQALFEATYATELRAETAARAREILRAEASYYREATRLLQDTPPRPANWRVRRAVGKLWSVARLVKASFTFAGGADYLAWKIERHSGVKVALTPWQRRHPVIAGALLLPRLLRRRAIR